MNTSPAFLFHFENYYCATTIICVTTHSGIADIRRVDSEVGLVGRDENKGKGGRKTIVSS
jgi:hypothetical protein